MATSKSTCTPEQWAAKLATDRARYKAKLDAAKAKRAKRSEGRRAEYAERKAANRCTRCNAGKPEPGMNRCRYCREDVKFYNSEYRKRKRKRETKEQS